MTGEVSEVAVSNTVDPMELRQTLGQFPTGVTIVTTLDQQQQPVGMTASSFNSLSLTPPLILWSIDKKTGCFDAFNHCEHFAVHVLTEQQAELSTHFAKRGVDKFAGLELDAGITGAPLLPTFCARFECEVENRYEGGDHIIMVGRVLHMQRDDSQRPLGFHRGKYVNLSQ